MDMSKHRRLSSFAGMQGSSDNFIRESILKESIYEFDLYQKYAPNTRDVYVNNNSTPIRGTMIDASEIGTMSDNKWLLIPLTTNVFVGDVLLIDNRKWICVYDKEKTTQNCHKVKIAPCNYQVRMPFYTSDNQPYLYTADVIALTFMTDTRDFKQPFPQEGGIIYVTIPYNEMTKQIKKQKRIWLFDGANEITGVDYTNVDYYTNHGYLKLTCKPTTESMDLDRADIGVCDYYKFFPRSASSTITPIATPTLTITTSSQSVKTRGQVSLTAQGLSVGDIVKFEFMDNTLGSILLNVTDSSCILRAGNDIGIVRVKCYLASDPTIYTIVRLVVSNK